MKITIQGKRDIPCGKVLNLQILSIQLLSCLILSGCSKHQNSENSVSNGKYKMTITTSRSQTKSYWEDHPESDSKNAIFRWEKSSDVVSVLESDSGLQTWYDDYGNNDTNYVLNEVTPMDTEDGEYAVIKSLKSTNDISNISVGNKVHYFLPYSESVSIDNSSVNGEVAVTMGIPHIFNYEQCKVLSELKRYSYMYLSTTVKSINEQNQIVVASGEFKAIPTVLRVKLTNKLDMSKDLYRVSVSTLDSDNNLLNSFTTKAVWRNGTVEYSSSERDVVSGVSIECDNVNINPDETKSFYIIALPNKSVGQISYAVVTVTVDDGNKLFSQYCYRIASAGFQEGHIYDFNISIGQKTTFATEIYPNKMAEFNMVSESSFAISEPVVDPSASSFFAWPKALAYFSKSNPNIDGTSYYLPTIDEWASVFPKLAESGTETVQLAKNGEKIEYDYISDFRTVSGIAYGIKLIPKSKNILAGWKDCYAVRWDSNDNDLTYRYLGAFSNYRLYEIIDEDFWERHNSADLYRTLPYCGYLTDKDDSYVQKYSDIPDKSIIKSFGTQAIYWASDNKSDEGSNVGLFLHVDKGFNEVAYPSLYSGMAGAVRLFKMGENDHLHDFTGEIINFFIDITEQQEGITQDF